MTRQELINQGLLTPASFFESLDEKHPRRVAYEKKLILIGDLDTFNSSTTPVSAEPATTLFKVIVKPATPKGTVIV